MQIYRYKIQKKNDFNHKKNFSGKFPEKLTSIN